MQRGINMFQLLIVDDEIESLEWLVELFESCGEEIAIYTASTARKALELLQDIKFDIVLTDIQMPGMNGLELYKNKGELVAYTNCISYWL